MAPKRAPSKAAYPVPATWLESSEARRRRLRPDLYPAVERSTPSSFAAPVPAVTPPARTTGCHTAASAPPHSTSARLALSTRADAPIVRNCKRGSAADASSALAAHGIDELIAGLRQDKVARTSVGPAVSTWRTWQQYHRESLGPHVPVLPITPIIVITVGAMFKAGKYRSFQNYASAAKNAHVEAGHDWTQLLDHTRAWVTRSVLRGIGPARQSCSFVYHRLLLLPLTPLPLHPDGPQHPVRFALLAVAFLLREIEASTAVLGSWTIDTDTKEISWRLPATKSDHMALGVTRTWPCTCGLDTLVCPYHAAVEHQEWLTNSKWFAGPCTPLFPTSKGKHPSKQAVVTTIELLATMCGQSVADDLGNRRFGGHTLRVTGAQLLAVHGLEVQKIRILARHSGDTILRYVAEAPLKTLRADLGLSSGSTPGIGSIGPTTPAAGTVVMRKRIAKLEAAIANLRDDMQTQAQDVVALATGFARTDNRLFVQNLSTATVHVARPGDKGRTLCGWRHATSVQQNGCKSRHLRNLVDVPGSMMCDVCLHTEKAIAMGRLEAELSADEM